eukprot:TRINITY_DN2181_c1_g1_i7.p1 TRINITY_DN2181_c1_g1~~TRINITY_DN2181_c1_g1_i7.p1  ORF type:complete len:152 (+),score=37.62 TRINITY_DN2181_c1_g1_i7:189-644(+)
MPDISAFKKKLADSAEEQKGWPTSAGVPPPPSLALQLEMPSAAEARKAAASMAKKQRSPRRNDDLKVQRQKEQDWNKMHGNVFSKKNDVLQVNVRSYFDRWKEDQGGYCPREPSWKLPVERRPLIKKSASEPFVGKYALQAGAYGPWDPVF